MGKDKAWLLTTSIHLLIICGDHCSFLEAIFEETQINQHMSAITDSTPLVVVHFQTIFVALDLVDLHPRSSSKIINNCFPEIKEVILFPKPLKIIGCPLQLKLIFKLLKFHQIEPNCLNQSVSGTIS